MNTKSIIFTILMGLLLMMAFIFISANSQLSCGEEYEPIRCSYGGFGIENTYSKGLDCVEKEMKCEGELGLESWIGVGAFLLIVLIWFYLIEYLDKDFWKCEEYRGKYNYYP